MNRILNTILGVIISLIIANPGTSFGSSSADGRASIGDSSKAARTLSSIMNSDGEINSYTSVGTITASGFIGDGSGLTGVTPGTGTTFWTKSGNLLYPTDILDTVSIGTTTSANSLLFVDGTVTAIGELQINTSGILGDTNPQITVNGENGIKWDTQGDNISIGHLSGASLTTANDDNILIGRQTGQQLDLGDGNTAGGYQALVNGTSSSRNSIYGKWAGFDITGDDNTISGWSAATFMLGGDGNTIGGSGAAANAAEMNNSVIMGFNSAPSLSIGNKLIVIGTEIDVPTSNVSNYLNIGNIIFGTNIDGVGTVTSSGNLGIGTSTPQTALHIIGTTTITNGSLVIGSCFQMLDSDSGGLSDIQTLDGVMTVTQDTNGICDGI